MPKRIVFNGFSNILPPDTVYVGRPSKWGNPYHLNDYTREDSIRLYEIWIKKELKENPTFLNSLIGKNLACWCKADQVCHADILLKLTPSPINVERGSKWLTWTCPFCKGLYRFPNDYGGRTGIEEFKKKHSMQHHLTDTQTRLSSGAFQLGIEQKVREGEKEEMKIPQEALKTTAKQSGLEFIKVSDLGLGLGGRMEFTIVGDVEEAGTEKDRFYSVPVSYSLNGKPTKGQYRLNKATLRSFVPSLGDDTANWIGAHFTTFANMVFNPRTQLNQLGLTVIPDSVKRPSK